MTHTISRLLAAALAMAGGLMCWIGSGIADDLAARHHRLATLQEARTEPGERWKAPFERLLDPGAARHGISADYWRGRYEAVLPAEASNEADAQALLIAANATFRKAQREAAGKAPAVERLDGALQAYAGVLKNGGFTPDAAYNYEYVARLRDSVARAKGPVRATPAAPAPRNDDLPAGPTIHGQPGTHPPGTRGEEFEVITPMDYGEREAQPEPTPGRPLPRKG